MATLIALLRGINVGGHKKIAMADLRAIASGCGFDEVQTFIQSGNLVFTTKLRAPSAGDALEKAIEAKLGHTVDVIVRTAAEWSLLRAGNPFREASKKEPNRVMVLVSKAPPASDAVAALRARAAGERIDTGGGAVWVHYPAGVGRSKLSPSLIDKALGSPVTARNWNTVEKLHEMVGG